MKFLKKINARLVYTLFSFLVIAAGAVTAIQYAKGNWRFSRQGVVSELGLLSANSFPPGAQVFIDGRLVTATDETLYLEPGSYLVKIVKEGYLEWKKQLQVEKELVTQTNAQLFPAAPSLTPLTFTGVENISPSPDGQKILYYTASASAENKNGLYLLELNNNFLPLQKEPKFLAEDNLNINLEDAFFIWSPDSSEIIIITDKKEMLIDVNKKNNLVELADISFKRKQILSTWEEEMYLRERQFLSEFPEEILKIATESAKNVYISPDKKRLLYTATADLNLAENLIPPLVASNTQAESRELEIGSIYIYDREEDKNFKIAAEIITDKSDEASEATPEVSVTEGEATTSAQLSNLKQLLATDIYNKTPIKLESSPSAFTRLQASDSAQTVRNFNNYHSSLLINTLQWFPDSKHLVFIKDQKIFIMEYDATNKKSLYSGPFADDFIYPWPDGSKIIILTSFSPDTPKNLYAIELK